MVQECDGTTMTQDDTVTTPDDKMDDDHEATMLQDSDYTMMTQADNGL